MEAEASTACLPLRFVRQGLSLNLVIQQGQLVSELQGSLSLHLPSAGTIDQAPPHLAFYVGAGDQHTGLEVCMTSTCQTEPSLWLLP